MATYVVRAELPNGFKLIVDFVSEESRNEVKRSWKNYYSNIGVKASITTEKAGRRFTATASSMFGKAWSMFGKAWSDITNDQKLSIVEMMIEAI